MPDCSDEVPVVPRHTFDPCKVIRCFYSLLLFVVDWKLLRQISIERVCWPRFPPLLVNTRLNLIVTKKNPMSGKRHRELVD